MNAGMTGKNTAMSAGKIAESTVMNVGMTGKNTVMTGVETAGKDG